MTKRLPERGARLAASVCAPAFMLVLVLGACVTQLSPQQANVYNACIADTSDDPSGDKNTRIKSCNQLIDENTLDAAHLSQVYTARGWYHFYSWLFDQDMSDMTAVQKRAYARAMDDYTKAIALDPANLEALYRRVLVYNNLILMAEGEDDPQARQTYLAAGLADSRWMIERFPYDVTGYKARDWMHNHLPETRETWRQRIANNTTLIRLEPDSSYHHANRGLNERKLGAYDKALADYDTAIRLVLQNSGDEEALRRAEYHADKAEVFIDMGDYESAISEYGTAIDVIEDGAIIEVFGLHHYQRRCFTRAAANLELQAALEDCNKVLEVHDDMALTERALVYYRMDKYGLAFADIAKAVETAATRGDGFFVRGLIFRAQGKTQEAQSDFAMAQIAEDGILDKYARFGLRP